MKFGERLLQFS